MLLIVSPHRYHAYKVWKLYLICIVLAHFGCLLMSLFFNYSFISRMNSTFVAIVISIILGAMASSAPIVAAADDSLKDSSQLKVLTLSYCTS